MKYNCEKCGKDKERSIKVINPKADIAIICDYPQREEVFGKFKSPLKGLQVEPIKEQLEKYKIKLSNCSIIYAMSCYPGNKVSITNFKCCRSKLKLNLLQAKPKLILTFGEFAINSLLNLKNKESIIKLRNRIIPSYEFNCLIFSTHHPYEFISKNKTDWAKKFAFEKDFERITDLYHRKFYKRKKIDQILEGRNKISNMKIYKIETNEELQNCLIKLKNFGSSAFDIETNSLKAQAPEFKIRIFGFGTNKEIFVLDRHIFKDNENKMNEIILNFLQDSSILKIIQNKKYEEICSRIHFKKYSWSPTELGNLINNYFDTMLAVHTIDERKGCTSLDFQNLVRFGILPYNSEIKKYLETKNGEIYNNIESCPSDDLIKYNALDIATTYANYLVSKNLLKTEKQKWCYQFLCEGHDVFNNMYNAGLPISKRILENMDDDLTKKQNFYKKEIFKLDEVKQFIKEKNR